MITVETAEFLQGATSLSDMPRDGVPEVALCGRSNAGKSTLLNRLTGRNKLARVSGTPGRTQEINFFNIRINAPNGRREIRLVDLPGFGFAKFSKKQRESLSRLTVQYLSERSQLSALLLLVDSKRVPEQDEQSIQQLCFERDLPLIVAATKIDRLTQKDSHKALKDIAGALGLQAGDLAVSGEKTSPERIWELLLSAGSLDL